MEMPRLSTASDGSPYRSEPAPPRPAPPTPRDKRARVYSDILIAHSTVPGTHYRSAPSLRHNIKVIYIVNMHERFRES